MKKIVFMLCMSLAVTMCASPCMAKQKKVTYKYKASNKTLTISGKKLGHMQAGFPISDRNPDKYQYKWHSKRKKTEKIILKKGVRTIGDSAFYNFGKLKKVTFCKGIVAIGECAFSETGIQKIVLPNSVKKIGGCAFYAGMREGKLKSVKLSSELRTIGDAAFGGQSIQSIIIPSKVEKIEAGAFAQCDSLRKIVIKSKKIKTIGEEAFADIGKNAKIYIPKEREQDYREMIEGKLTSPDVQIIAR